MAWDQLTALASFGQFAVVAAAAVFAYLQLRGFGRQQEAKVVQHIFDELNAPTFAAALDFVYNDLPEKLRNAEYARAILEGRATVTTHPEFTVLHFFNELGLLVHAKVISELVVPFVATPCIRSWERLVPVIELLRRRFPHAYTPFESLVARSRAVDLAAINARFRAQTPQLQAQWERSAGELAAHRVAILDEPGDRA